MDVSVSALPQNIFIIEGAITAPIPSKKQPEAKTLAKRCRTWGIALLICLVTSEGGSWAAYWILTGAPLSLKRARAEQQGVATEAGAIDAGLLAGTGEGKLTQFVAHPYMGYTRQQNDRNAVPGQDFILGKQPLITSASPDTAIIGIFGGSVAEQFSRYGSGTLMRLLEEDPRYAGKRPVIFTAALGGFKQPQHLMALNYLLSLGQHFDLIINMDGFNEIAGPPTANLPKHVSPYFPSGWYHIADRLPDTQILGKIGAVAYGKQRRQHLAGLMLASPLLSHSSTAQFLWKGTDTLLSGTVSRAELALLSEAAVPKEASLELGTPYAYQGDRRLLQDIVDNWERSSVLMHDLAAAHGIPYLHFLQPNQYLPGTKPLSSEERRVAVNPYSPYPPWVTEGYPLLREAGKHLKAQGIDFHDLSTLFAHVPQTVYKDDCCHVNTLGNTLLGFAIGEAVQSHDRTVERIASR